MKGKQLRYHNTDKQRLISAVSFSILLPAQYHDYRLSLVLYITQVKSCKKKLEQFQNCHPGHTSPGFITECYHPVSQHFETNVAPRRRSLTSNKIETNLQKLGDSGLFAQRGSRFPKSYIRDTVSNRYTMVCSVRQSRTDGRTAVTWLFHHLLMVWFIVHQESLFRTYDLLRYKMSHFSWVVTAFQSTRLSVSSIQWVKLPK